MNLAEAYRHEGMLDDALRILREGLAREPDLVAGRAALGRLLLERGAVQEALAEAARIEALAPGTPEALEIRTEVLRRRRSDALPATPEDDGSREETAPPLASATLAALYLSQGYADRARAIAGSGSGAPEARGGELLRRLEALRRAAGRRRMERGR